VLIDTIDDTHHDEGCKAGEELCCNPGAKKNEECGCVNTVRMPVTWIAESSYGAFADLLLGRKPLSPEVICRNWTALEVQSDPLGLSSRGKDENRREGWKTQHSILTFIDGSVTLFFV
jgi:hypothetical protein